VNGGFEIPGRDFPQGHEPIAKKRVVGPGYFEALGIPILAGRAFDDGDRAGGHGVLIISDTIAPHFWPDGHAVGQSIRFSWGPGEAQEIVGVVGDVRHEGLDRPGDSMLYRPLEQFPQRSFGVVVRSTMPPRALERSLRSELAAIDSTASIYEVHTME